MNPRLLFRKCVAEFLGTFALVLFGCGSIRLGLSPAIVALVFGSVVGVMIYTLGHLSGAHFNPAVTLGFAAAKRLPLREVGPYWLAQSLGAALAAGAMGPLLPGAAGYGAVSSRLGPLPTFAWEVLLTFFLMLVIIAVATDPRAEGAMAGAAIGGWVTLGSLVGGPVTGSAMNPARYLGPALLEGNLRSAWVYIPAAFLGAVLAALLYEWIRCEGADRSPADCC